MKRQLIYFRPGEEARSLARCMFGAYEDGNAGASLTYPIKGYPWRRNIVRNFTFHLDTETVSTLFAEPKRIRSQFPEQCLDTNALWNDSSEKANGITRDRATGTLCYTIVITTETGAVEENFALRENDIVLTSSALYNIVTTLIEPHEHL